MATLIAIAGGGWRSGRLVRLAAVVLVAASAGAAPGTAALAADPPLTLTARMSAVTITPGMRDDSPGREGVLELLYSSPAKLPKLSLEPARPVYPVALIDVSHLAGAATAQFPDDCRAQGTVMRCPMVGGLAAAVHMVFRAAPGASGGSSGSISFTVTARNGTGPAKGDSSVNLVDGPDLVGDSDTSTDATLDSPVDFRVGVTNWGDAPVDEFAIFVAIPTVVGRTPPECVIFNGGPESSPTPRCTIRQRLAPGEHWAGTLIQTTFEELRTVMELLGHSTIRLTSDTYGHVLPALDREATSGIDRLLGEGR